MSDAPPVSPKGFISNPTLRWVTESGDTQELIEPLVYVSGDGKRFIVPPGFITDYASIPSIFWNLPGFNPTGPAKIPAILHDYLYNLRGDQPYRLNRHRCDDIFLEAMQFVGVNWLHRQIIYRAVRLFGGLHSIGRPWAK